MLPKATLLGGAGTTFMFRFGSKSFNFINGEGERVPVAVALALRDRKMPGGRDLFKIEDMPEIVSRAAKEVVPVVQDGKAEPRQLRF